MWNEHGISVSATTIRRDLLAKGFKAKVRPRGPRRYELDEPERLAFCKSHVGDDRLIEKIVFSDEKFSDCNDHGSRHQWCGPKEQAMHAEAARWAPKIHVWGCIGVGIKRLIVFEQNVAVTASFYVNTVLKPCRSLLRGRLFQQDGARAHTAGETQTYLASNRIKCLPSWPARSPDISPIETMWAMVQKRVDRMGPTSVKDLTVFWKQCWDEIPQSQVDALVRGWGDRLRRCVKARGASIVRKRRLAKGSAS
jgi:hypothetical protein